ncbi:hypothetical protein LX64_01413 [Chitinophaga skermanii]|uniref:Natural product n=1 Tax=Chitinophaga skermanii TaxID=331697 RepID=A0A327QVY5_9BACT|nr:class I lanthipeptide [Chitinophaga skermanii]RAJ08759.1 hypothetical protein LX64_01413 [Chitinophaga skermanii]
MKKKKIQLSKLNFEKSVIAQLNPIQQSDLKGGAATVNSLCRTTYYQTCESYPFTEDFCVRCNTGAN